MVICHVKKATFLYGDFCLICEHRSHFENFCSTCCFVYDLRRFMSCLYPWFFVYVILTDMQLAPMKPCTKHLTWANEVDVGNCFLRYERKYEAWWIFFSTLQYFFCKMIFGEFFFFFSKCVLNSNCTRKLCFWDILLYFCHWLA